MEATVANILVIAALGLLITVTGGVAYLTAIDWRDRRRREEEEREQLPSRSRREQEQRAKVRDRPRREKEQGAKNKGRRTKKS